MTAIPPTVTLPAPSFAPTDYERLSEHGRGVVGQAFRYVMHLGALVEAGKALPPAYEDASQRRAWLRLAKKAPLHERGAIRGMLADAMGAAHAIRQGVR